MGKIQTVNIDTDNGSVQGYDALPVPLVHQFLENAAIPITIGGTSNRTFTVNASTTNPVPIMIGNDFAELTASVSYSDVVGTNTILDSTGAETTRTNNTVGWKYYYISVDSTTGLYEILPSDTAPAFSNASINPSSLVHPGTAATQCWTYVGISYCNATTPTFVAAEKIGKTYNYESLPGTPVLTAVIDTTFAALASFALPKHDIEVRGILETGATADDWAWVSGSATENIGTAYAVTEAAKVLYVPTPFIEIGSDGLLYGKANAVGDFHVSAIKDRV